MGAQHKSNSENQAASGDTERTNLGGVYVPVISRQAGEDTAGVVVKAVRIVVSVVFFGYVGALRDLAT